jgi:hypothetical protein
MALSRPKCESFLLDEIHFFKENDPQFNSLDAMNEAADFRPQDGAQFISTRPIQPAVKCSICR